MYAKGKGVNKDLAEAERLFRKIPENSVKGYYGLAYYIHYKNLNYQEAIRNIDKAIERDSKYIYSYSLRGLVYLERKEYEKALADLNQAMKLDNETSYIWLYRALYYAEIRDFSKSAEDIAHSCQLVQDKKKEEYCNALAGMIFFMKGDHTESLSRFDHALNVRPDYTLALLGKGHVHFRLGKTGEARQDFEKIRKQEFENDWDELDFPEIRIFDPALQSAALLGIALKSSAAGADSLPLISLKYLKKPVFVNISGVSKMIPDTVPLLLDTDKKQILFPYENVNIGEQEFRDGEEIRYEGSYQTEADNCKLHMTITTDFDLDHFLLFGAKLSPATKELIYSPALRWKHTLIAEIPASLLEKSVPIAIVSKDGRTFNRNLLAKNGKLETAAEEGELKNDL
ncbi:MAG: tetratricopeptide repeat protein [Desulfobacterales bacterium]